MFVLPQMYHELLGLELWLKKSAGQSYVIAKEP
jgi:hypothetical protein